MHINERAAAHKSFIGYGLANRPTLGRDWPEDGCERAEVDSSYKLALTRAAAGGHIIRKASGSNA